MAAAILALSSGTGCGKKCNQPVTTPFKFLRETQWRLIETDNPAPEYRRLSKYTFQNWEFGVNFTGQIFTVINNDQQDTPFRVFKWNVDKDAGILLLQLQSPIGEEDEEGNVAGGEDLGTIEFSYKMGRNLELVEAERGYVYKFVPFQGVVDPDNTCEF